MEELNEKLKDHSETQIAGFVVDSGLMLKKEIVDRTREIADMHDVQIYLLEFEDWVGMQFERSSVAPDKLAWNWLWAFSESICQRRRDRAPIDEPSDSWVRQLGEAMDAWLKSIHN